MACSHAQAQLTAIKEVMAERRKSLDDARRQKRNLLRWEERCRRRIRDVAFILFVWCAPSGALALAYVAHMAQTKQYDAEVSLKDLEERYLRTDVEVLTAINSEESGMSQAAFAEATRFRSQHALCTWVQHQNDTRGVAPNASMVQKHLANTAVAPVATAHPQHAARRNMVSVHWVQRFRKRWALRRGKFMPGERMTPGTIGTKVAPCKRKQPQCLSIFWRFSFGPVKKKGAAW